MSRGIYFDDIRLQLKLQTSALKRCPFGGRQKLAIPKRRSNGKTHFGLRKQRCAVPRFACFCFLLIFLLSRVKMISNLNFLSFEF